MLGLVTAILKLALSNQKIILEHLIFLHRAVGSPKSNYEVLRVHQRIIDETMELVERNEANDVSDL